VAFGLLAWLTPAAVLAEPLEVVATLPDLGSLASEIGGDEVSVRVLGKGPQDPHFIEPKPSFIRVLHDADLYMQVGMELEIGWAPVLLRSARNPDLLPGGRGHLDASAAIDPLDVPTVAVDRAVGDVHPYGHPHYLTDPVNGLRVAALIRDKLAELRPGRAGYFGERYAVFAHGLAQQLVGPELAARHDSEQLVRQVEHGELDSFLRDRQERDLLAGWLGAVREYGATQAVEDHRLWSYFARRFGLTLVTTLEPRPGIAPTTRHLGSVVEAVRAQQVRVILSSPYFDPRHARWVAERTRARVVPLAHQAGAREGTKSYLDTIDYNVRRLLEALEATRRRSAGHVA
jgi:ABC-type Zn uptake system ZnuABC Zn-binding protein ZnuA